MFLIPSFSLSVEALNVNDAKSLLSETCLIFEPPSSPGEEGIELNSFIGFTKRAICDDNYDVGVFELSSSTAFFNLDPVKNLFDDNLLKEEGSKYVIKGNASSPPIPLIYDSTITEKRLFYSPFAKHGPQWISSDLSDKNLVLQLNDPIILQTVDGFDCNFGGLSGSVVEDGKGNQIGLLVGSADNRCIVLPFRQTLFDQLNVEKP